MKILTVQLRNGLTVLAKQTKWGISALTYANHAQANNKIAELSRHNILGYATPTRPQYIVIQSFVEEQP